MSVPKYDLSKAQFSSEANSFKNDGAIYTGTITGPTAINSGSFVIVSTVVTLSSSPQFSTLFANFQEYIDGQQQYFYGTGYSGAAWYDCNVNNKVSLMVTAPAPQAGPIPALLYPVINGNQVTVTLLVNNPYSVNITITALPIPYAFIEYTMTN